MKKGDIMTIVDMSSSFNKNRNNSRILLVDDEPDAALVYKIVLEHNRFKVDSFTDPLLALSNFKPNLYDLAILDIKMPNMNGFKLYQEIKKIDSNVKVCFLTASEMFYEDYRKNEVAEEDVTALDKDLFLLKPLSNQDLLQQVNRIMMSH
jgi:DNA-binding response OmpR family regulator